MKLSEHQVNVLIKIYCKSATWRDMDKPTIRQLYKKGMIQVDLDNGCLGYSTTNAGEANAVLYIDDFERRQEAQS